MVAATFAVPGQLDQPTGGYAYDRRIIAELRRIGCDIDVIDLGDGFPHPPAETLRAASASLKRLATGRPIIIDGLALGVLPEAAQQLAATHPLVALVHHPLALESGISAATAAALRQSEHAALAAVRHTIVTSAATARLLAADYAVPEHSITVVRPGNDPAPVRAPVPTATARGTLNLLAVGAVVPRKGYDVLIEALARLTDLDWHLTIAGDCTRDRDAAGALATRSVLLRLGPRVRMAGAVSEEELSRLYGEADLFVLASRHEGYGMAFAEAINHGLPVVGTKAGAIAETVTDRAAILVPPGDIGALAAALRTMVADTAMRARCAAAARRAALDLPRWDAAGRAFFNVLRAII